MKKKENKCEVAIIKLISSLCGWLNQYLLILSRYSRQCLLIVVFHQRIFHEPSWLMQKDCFHQDELILE